MKNNKDIKVINQNKVNVYLVFDTLGKLLSEQYGYKITFTVEPKKDKNCE